MDSNWLLDITILTLLGFLLAVVLWLHTRLRLLVRAQVQLPFLADNLTRALKESKEGVSLLATTARTQVPALAEQVEQAKDVLLELDYVLNRAEKVLKQFDDRLQAMAELQEAARVVGGKADTFAPPTDTAAAAGADAAAALLLSNISRAAPSVEEMGEVNPLAAVNSSIRGRANAGGVALPRRMATPVATVEAYRQMGQAHTVVPASEAEEDIRRAMYARL